MSRWQWARALYRSFFGFCPRCNYCAPELDDCNVCQRWRPDWRESGSTYPPRYRVRAYWLYRYCMIEDGKMPASFREHQKSNPAGPDWWKTQETE